MKRLKRETFRSKNWIDIIEIYFILCKHIILRIFLFTYIIIDFSNYLRYSSYSVFNYKNLFILLTSKFIRPDVVQKRDKLWFQFPLEKMKYLIFSFPRSSNEAKRGFIAVDTYCLKNSAESGKRNCLNENGVSQH